VSLLYRVAFSFADRVSFENPDDAEFFLRNGLVRQRQIVLVRGSGVDTSEFEDKAVGPESRARLLTELHIPHGAVVVATVCRMLRTKGVEDFIEASEILSKSHPNAIFLLIGDSENGNPLSLSHTYLRSKAGDRLLWLGWRLDVRDLLSVCDIAVLLTRHREGVPGTMLEAMAMGRPLVATDVPGCREVVEHGVNGYLVPPCAPVRAAEAIANLIVDEVRRRDFGAQSRRKAESEFAVAQVNNTLIAGLYPAFIGTT
jgi:N,N'-diacetylbacillosaminyl-diphospho-undecaprenol alpha-1,3-N-acetylgalactosaminyltransferase